MNQYYDLINETKNELHLFTIENQTKAQYIVYSFSLGLHNLEFPHGNDVKPWLSKISS